MQTAQIAPQARELPPLILHPFADPGGPGKLVESSRASLIMQGLLPSDEQTQEDLDRAVLEGRYCEIRMLYYVGRDLVRWIEQCIEYVERKPELAQRNLRFQSFAEYLVRATPLTVQAKLRKWGVADYKAIFTRAIGLNRIFAEIPPKETLSDDFIRNYYRYADQFYAMCQSAAPHSDINPREFEFELYASGEYSRMLERSWEKS
jgi:hypothetical protein